MRHARLAYAFAIALLGATVVAEAQGRPANTPPGPPPAPVPAPIVPPENPSDSLIEFVCSMLPVPYLCD